MQKPEYDLAVIGAGPGGYVAAIRAAQAGLKVCLIDKAAWGGVCLNVGCIPTKALLKIAKEYKSALKGGSYGLHYADLVCDFQEMQNHKKSLVDRMRGNIEALLKSYGVVLIQGKAALKSAHEIVVETDLDIRSIHASYIILATGSIPLPLSSLPFDNDQILCSSGILALSNLPKSLVVVGGGYIGCEFASLYSSLGVKVTIIEAFSSLVASLGSDLSEGLMKCMKKDGIDLRLETEVIGCEKKKDTVLLEIRERSSGKKEILESEKILVAVGRAPHVDDIGLDKLNIERDSRGFVKVNDNLQTNIPHIMAVGDLNGQSMLAHVASHQAMLAVDHITGKMVRPLEASAIPAVVFTFPELASVGLTPEAAKKSLIPVTVGKVPFAALGRAFVDGQTEGFAQIVIRSDTGQIIGAQVLGAQADLLIAEMTIAILHEVDIDSFLETIRAHPTRSEIWLEAALMAQGRPLHWRNR